MFLPSRILYVFVFVCGFTTSEVPRPRGVSLSRAPLYNPTKDFTCLDQSLTIPFSLVNDDYCDCPDASDEPGTSACFHGVFHCTNAGHRPINIASSRVNDGVCDCCDASDEYLSNKCVNNCKELGRSAREAELKQAELLKAGKQLRQELISEGIKLKQAQKEKLVELQKQKVEAEQVLAEKGEIKKAYEEEESVAVEHYRKIEEEQKRKQQEAEAAATKVEATETFVRFDSNQDGLVDVAELQSRATFDKDRNGEVSEEEAKHFLNEKDSVQLEEFILDAWPRIKPYMMMDSGLFTPPAGEGSVEEVPLNDNKPVEEEYEEEEDHHDEPQEEHEEEEEEEGHHEEEHHDEEHHDEEHHEEEPAHEEETAPTIQYDEETQNLINKATQARNEFNEVQKGVQSLMSEINDIEEYMKKDYGPDESFAALIGNCFEYTDYEYIYKLCPFDKATQQAKSGTVDTRLGTWAKWVGPANNLYEFMLFDNGQSCWNGPQRSTRVKVSCSSENRLVSVSEPNRCEYLFEFTTPAACYEVPEEQSDTHDEL